MGSVKIFYFKDFGRCRAESVDPGHIKIFSEDTLLGEIIIDIYHMKVTYTVTDLKHQHFLDMLSSGVQDSLDHPGQWLDHSTGQWRNYNDLHPTYL